MGSSALTEPLQETFDTHEIDNTTNTGVSRVDTWSRQESPGLRLLDALRSGDDLGVLEVCGETTTMSAPGMGWSCQGPEDILGILAEAKRRFPGLTVDPRTRDIGFGLVIDDVRIQDALPVEPEGTDEVVSAEEQGSGESFAERLSRAQPVSAERAVAVWREDFLTPMRLNLPVRLSVRHDDLQVHEILVEFPAALLKRALGIYVDPLEMSLSEVQSAFIAPVGTGFTTRRLASSTVTAAPQVESEAETETDVIAERPRRRRRRVLLPVLVLLLAVGAAAGWWFLRGPGSVHEAVAPVAAVSPTPTTPLVSTQPSAQPAAQVSTSKAPVVTTAKPSDTPSRKPNVTLRSDLAFGFNSSTLSPQAKQAIDQVAGQVRSAGLSGKIYVDGYTDNLGSQAYGMLLSQRRADAVSHYLGSQLVGVPVSIVSIGLGETHPVAANSTAQGRKANRRVTITLPTS
jgi:outer membrane protein OmpA-like peptidoglycan-associated protein